MPLLAAGAIFLTFAGDFASAPHFPQYRRFGNERGAPIVPISEVWGDRRRGLGSA
jgi:hypothetical protein